MHLATSIRQHLLSSGLIAGGAVAAGLSWLPLSTHPETSFPANPLGIFSSPYGEVFAMAMQGPIDLYWHGGAEDDHHHDHHHDGEAAHEHGPESDHSPPPEPPAATLPSPTPRLRFAAWLDSLHSALETRTNPREQSPAHKFYIRRGIENKLRFAYRLDPAHYGNYNSYHFFLTEPQIGTRPQLTAASARLAEQTIAHCLADPHDPRPSLTAAAAASNLLDLMFIDQFNESPRFTTTQMREMLGWFDTALARHEEISRIWEQTGHWNIISPMRFEESRQRLQFIRRVREAAESTILRLESQNALQAPTSPQAPGD